MYKDYFTNARRKSRLYFNEWVIYYLLLKEKKEPLDHYKFKTHFADIVRTPKDRKFRIKAFEKHFIEFLDKDRSENLVTPRFYKQMVKAYNEAVVKRNRVKGRYDW